MNAFYKTRRKHGLCTHTWNEELIGCLVLNRHYLHLEIVGLNSKQLTTSVIPKCHGTLGMSEIVLWGCGQLFWFLELQGSISPTFFACVFRTNVFFLVTFCFVRMKNVRKKRWWNWPQMHVRVVAIYSYHLLRVTQSGHIVKAVCSVTSQMCCLGFSFRSTNLCPSLGRSFCIFLQ